MKKLLLGLGLLILASCSPSISDTYQMIVIEPELTEEFTANFMLYAVYHELGHVKLEHKINVDEETRKEQELMADLFAFNMLVAERKSPCIVPLAVRALAQNYPEFSYRVEPWNNICR